ncbi:hypothetical protein OAA49_00615 [Flavobacteriales bacterium]|nr:hypothetical protein [Flavobacteriales bacterium]
MISAINIVAFDVPFPANYGGVIDVFHKIKTFNQLGVKVHLHCFEYGRGNQPELEQYCESVNYYKRKSSWIYALSSKPYIVITRKSRELKKNLLSNDFPILFEGLHTCYLLNDKDLKDRITIYRESNIEHRYYNHLAKSEVYWIKKIYLNIEARKLKKFESTVEKASMNFIVSETDFHYFEMKYGKLSNHFIPSFHEHNEVVIPDGLGKFVFYHGNLSVSENYEAAMHLIKNIFSVIKVPFIIAGLNPPEFLIKEVEKHSHISLIANVSQEKVTELLENAQINFLYTNQATGLKLKLLNVLYHGRHCLVNSKMVEGTTLSEICQVEDSVDKQIILVKQLMEMPIGLEDKIKRIAVLSENYSNIGNAKKMFEAISDLQ